MLTVNPSVRRTKLLLVHAFDRTISGIACEESLLYERAQCISQLLHILETHSTLATRLIIALPGRLRRRLLLLSRWPLHCRHCENATLIEVKPES